MTTTQGASAEPNVLTIPIAIMEIPCAVTLSHFPTRHEMAAYKQGHRAARHAAADLVLARADELKALAAQPAEGAGQAGQVATGDKPFAYVFKSTMKMLRDGCSVMGEIHPEVEPGTDLFEPIYAAPVEQGQGAAPSEKAAAANTDHREGVAGLRPYEFMVQGQSLRWYLKRDVDALLATRTPAADTDNLADVLRDMMAIQGACGLHTDEYAPGSVIEHIKELEADRAAATSAAGQEGA